MIAPQNSASASTNAVERVPIPDDDLGMDQEQLKSAIDRMRRIRHDANSPLTVALGHTQLLLDEADRLPAETRQSLSTVESELRRLIEILRGLDGVRDSLVQAGGLDGPPP